MLVVENTLAVTLQYERRSTAPERVAVPEQFPHPAQSRRFVVAKAAQVFLVQSPVASQPHSMQLG